MEEFPDASTGFRDPVQFFCSQALKPGTGPGLECFAGHIRYTTMDATGNSLTQFPITLMDGSTTSLGDFAGQVVLVVNVASRCGFTPQYAGLEKLYESYKDLGFAVLGFPSNQFLQELSSDEKVAEFCSTNYGVTFPMSQRVKVNGKHAHPLFTALHNAKDSEGSDGKVKWNFEKFLILPTGEVHRFRSKVEPEAPEIVELIEANLPQSTQA